MKLTCDEIYFASNQKSALTGNDGFGVRTYTAGMDTSEVSLIARDCLPGYQVDPERQLSLADLEANPEVVLGYPAVYSFSSFASPSGQTLWVASRTVYIATDFGFFLDGNAYSRVGSNYFTHAIISATVPPPSLLSAMTQPGVFVPGNYEVRRDNAELRTLLTGEPELLPKREIDLPDAPAPVDPAFVRVAAGVLQAALNRAVGSKPELQKMIVKASSADVDKVVGVLAAMPASLMPHLRFITNFMKGYGVPEESDIIVVNEFNKLPLYENNYITVDLMAGTSVNIADNPFISAITDALAAGKMKLAGDMMEFFLGINHGAAADYRTQLATFKALQPDAEITVADISPELLAATSMMSPVQLSLFVSKVNEAINSALLSSQNPAELEEAIKAVALVRGKDPAMLSLSADARKRITKLIMGVNSYAGKILTPQNADTVLWIADRAEVASDAEFYNAVKQVSDPYIWEFMLSFYFNADPEFALPDIVSAILASALPPTSREQLIARLFLPGASAAMLSYLLAHPDSIRSLPVTVAAISKNSPDEIFSRLIEASGNNPDVIRMLGAPAARYFSDAISAQPDLGARKLLDFIARVTPTVYASMISAELFMPYLDYVCNYPSPAMRGLVDEIAAVPGIPEAQKAAAVSAMLAGTDPGYVDMSIMKMAHRQNLDPNRFQRVLTIWYDHGATSRDVVTLNAQAGPLSNEEIKAIVWVTWNRFANTPEVADRMNTILDNCKWNPESRLRFMAECPDKKLVAFLNDQNKFFSSLLRKVRNIFNL